MSENHPPDTPTGLTRHLLVLLRQSADSAQHRDAQDLLHAADTYLEQIHLAHKRYPLVNLRLAQAIVEAMRTVAGEWDQIALPARGWLLGAMHFFINDDDDEPDLTSPIGFEDDAEVLNACLILAGREDLCLNTEDFDDA